MAQDSEPEFVPYVNDMQMFDQPDLSQYGRGTSPPEGWFGAFDYLTWSQQGVQRLTIGQPGSQQVFNPGASTANTGDLALTTYTNVIITQVVTITGGLTTTNTTNGQPVYSTFIRSGVPSLTPTTGTILNGSLEQSSGLDTSFMASADFSSGGRAEFGRMVDGRGWIVSGFGWSVTQSLEASYATVNFDNPPSGFVDVRRPTGFTADGIDDDLDGDTVYGRYGRDRGTIGVLNGITIYTGLPDGEPDPEPAGTSVPVDYDDAVAFPSRFAKVTVENRTGVWNLEMMRMWQMAIGPRGGVWEAFVGPRFININDQYMFNATTGAAGSFDTYFDTNAQNYLLGGQFGGRWSRQRRRTQLSFEGRGFVGANFQHVTQEGQIGNPAVGNNGAGGAINLQVPAAFSHTANQTEFAPGGELRMNLRYQLFRSLYVNAGYTALFAQNVARGSQMTFYSMPSMGILEDENKSSFFVHGLNLGLVFNR